MDKIPQPIIAAQPISNTIRQLFEQCQNSLDQDSKRRAITEAWQVPQGTALVTCRRTKSGEVTITVKMVKNGQG